MMAGNFNSDKKLQQEIIHCTRCARLVAWCQDIAKIKVKRFENEQYWGKPVPSFGDLNARLLIVGLAPAAHGANRTGRMFTGDRSGDWLYSTLYGFGFCSKPISSHLQDGLELYDCRITAIAHCAPPQNKLDRQEIVNCSRFLKSEFALMKRIKVIIALGQIAFREILIQMNSSDKKIAANFSHGTKVRLAKDVILLASYHPSQQNTFTGRLTKPMFQDIFRQAKQLLR